MTQEAVGLFDSLWGGFCGEKNMPMTNERNFFADSFRLIRTYGRCTVYTENEYKHMLRCSLLTLEQTNNKSQFVMEQINNS